MIKKHCYYILVVLVTFSCKEDIKIGFYEDQIEASDDAEISINIPKAKGDLEVSERINNSIKTHIISQTTLSEDATEVNSIKEAVQLFNSEFIDFKSRFPESSQKWEAFIDGEVTYRSPEIISIAINSYLDTGGAHGNTNIKFFNFNPVSGETYTNEALMKDKEALSNIIAKRLKEELKSDSNDSMEDVFFGKDFQLPESLGFSDEGLIILYNPYEIASYSQGIIEFTLPYEEVSTYLNIH